ncbi:hypothetical protein L1887_33772 [Cichorium endivia]|nr:hypothetical protein L1887_33772 [Cichorium endivia]
MKMNPGSSHTIAAITIFRGGETTSGASMEATGGAFGGRRRRGGQRIMAKPIKELKKENNFLKGKTEKSDITLIQLVEEKQLEKTKNKKEKLESLCRSLQAERKQNSSGQSNANSVPVESESDNDNIQRN